VIRLSGTNAEEGMAILRGHPKLETAPTMQEAARMIVQLAGGAR
jgi:succinyl-CoA synthetase beta subunit